jgi:drug/metabolite transporter (DMT)-like permease
MNRAYTPSSATLTLRDSIVTVLLLASFGANAVAVKISFTGIGVYTSAGIRFALAALFIIIWIRATGRSLAISSRNLKRALILGIAFTIQLSLFYKGISLTTATRAILIGNLQPFFLLFFAHFFIPGDTFTLRKLAGLLLGISGIILLINPQSVLSGAHNNGDVMILGSTVLWAATAVYIKLIIEEMLPSHIVLYQLLFSAPLFLLEGFLWDTTMISHIDGAVIGSMLFQSAVTGSLGFIAWNTLIKKYGTVALHSYLFIMPIAGVSLSWLLLGEDVTTLVFASLALVVAGIIVVNSKTGEDNLFIRWIRRF